MMRERVNFREGNGKRQDTYKGGWTVVSRRRGSAGSGRRSDNDIRASSQAKGGLWRKKKSSTIFIDNLPDFYDRNLLKKLFKGMGRVLDAHIPWRKREKKKTRFGFVIFEREDEAEGALRKLNGIIIFCHKLSMEMSFIGGHRRVTRKVGEAPLVYQDTNQFRKDGVSYAQAVGKRKHMWVKRKKEGFPTMEEKSKNTRDNNGDCKWEVFMKRQQEQGEKLAEIETLCVTLKDSLKFLMDKFEEICEE